MSHTAIAAVLARTDLAMGERLVALSLASFANRDDRAFPGNAAAAARAGLGRSRYLEARDQLVARGLIAIESAGRGRGQTTTLTAKPTKARPPASSTGVPMSASDTLGTEKRFGDRSSRFAQHMWRPASRLVG